jgi:hypothetical protein
MGPDPLNVKTPPDRTQSSVDIEPEAPGGGIGAVTNEVYRFVGIVVVEKPAIT